MAAFYSDIDLSFKAHPVTGDIVTKKDYQAVAQSVRNLIYTNEGEILMEPEIAGGVRKALFELNNVHLRTHLFDRIKYVIGRHEPRVDIDDVDVTSLDLHVIKIKIIFHMLNQPESYSVEVPLRRTR